MRFALTATDRYLGVFRAFVDAGMTPVKLFVPPVDGRLHESTAVVALAQTLGMAIQLSRLDDAALADLAAQGCELLVVASYPWRIGDWQRHLPKAINFHPSPLPEGRGPYPQVKAIVDGRPDWGVSCHALTHEWDAGPILAQRRFGLSAHECHDSLDLKIQMHSHALAEEVAANLDELWSKATPQGLGDHTPMYSDADRTLNFADSADRIGRQLRAFGPIGCLAVVNGVPLHVHQAVTWTQAHDARPGQVMHTDGLRTVLACRDGMVGVTAWGLFGPDTVVGTPSRP
jgi:methionyl-tRNA formyltransferase